MDVPTAQERALIRLMPIVLQTTALRLAKDLQFQRVRRVVCYGWIWGVSLREGLCIVALHLKEISSRTVNKHTTQSISR